jgi:rSAM/selenodomain-associated transferase 2
MPGNNGTVRISIIVPVLNEAAIIVAALQALQPLRECNCEVVVADGGSSDATRTLALALADRLVEAPLGRASQMNAGAAVAGGRILVFLHADTRLPQHADVKIRAALQRSERSWGRFDVCIDGRHPALALVAAMMNARSRLTGIATGDQALFMSRGAFDAVGGFPALELMEDIAICARLKRVSRPVCLRDRVVTSGRRWELHGVMRTILLMWWLRLRFFCGAAPSSLARLYRGGRTA